MGPAKFQVQAKETESKHHLYLRGELDLAAAPYFRSVLEPLLNQTKKTLVLNCKELNYIDSTGMGIIILVLKTRLQNGSGFMVEDVPKNIKKLFDLTGISKFLPAETAGQ
jgi:anti-sigma B factor antagonist